MNKLFKDNENRICIGIFVITIMVAIIPLISRYCINGHDIEYHLLRIESLKEGIMIGKPFLKVNTLFFGDAGYASSMFYGDLFLYIPALMRVLGISIGTSYHVFVAIIFILCYGSTFYCTYRITSSKYAATLAAVLLTLCPYHMDDMLVRAACGEYTAFIFIPFIVYGVYNILYEEMNSPWVFGIGFAGLILTHPATLVLNVILCAVVFLIYIKRFIKAPKLIIRLLVTSVITVLVTAFMWVPMIEQMLTSKFYVSTDKVDMLDAALNMSEIFTQVFPGVGILLILLAVPRVFISAKDNEILRFTDVLVVGGIVYAVCASNIVPWNRLSHFLGFVQFPWRLFTMTSALLAIADAVIIMIFIKEKSLNRDAVVMVVLIVSIALSLEHNAQNIEGYYDYGNDYYSYKPYTANVIGAEWLPVTVTDRDNLVTISEYAYGDDGSTIDFTRQRAEIDADIEKDMQYVDVPFIYYKGYFAEITDGNIAHKLDVTSEGIDGMCRVYLNGEKGKLNVRYRGTTAQNVSYVISIISIVGIAIFFVCRKRNRSKG